MLNMNEISVKTLKIGVANKEKQEFTVWSIVYTLKALIEFMQYTLDNANNPEEFWILDVEEDIAFKMCDIAKNQFQMRKRTFDERMNDIQTAVINESKIRKVR